MKKPKIAECVLLFAFVFIFVSTGAAQQAMRQISLTAEVLKLNKRELRLQFKIKNNSDVTFLIATDPIEVFGKKGYYLLVDEGNPSLLKIFSRVYPDPPFYPLYDDRGVVLKRLSPNEIYTGIIRIKSGTEETSPPYDKDLLKLKKVLLKNIERIELVIGYFVEDEGIRDFLSKKRWGWVIYGAEKLDSGTNKGKTFLEIQNLLSAVISLPGNR